MKTETNKTQTVKESIKNDLKWAENQGLSHIEEKESDDTEVEKDGSKVDEGVKENEEYIDDKSNREDGSEVTYTRVLVTKTIKIQDLEDDQDTEAEMANYIHQLVQTWIKRKDIVCVQDLYDGQTTTELENYNTWLSDPRQIGQKTVKVELFFAVELPYSLKEIVEKDKIKFKRDNVWIEQKRTGYEHTNKVGFLTGPIVKRANMNYYENLIKYLGKLNEGEVEIKKKMVYKGQEEEWCITVHSI